MEVPFTTQEIERVPKMTQAGELLDGMVHGTVPAMVIEEKMPFSTVSGFPWRFKPLLYKHRLQRGDGVTHFHRRYPLSIDNMDPHSMLHDDEEDKGLHIDGNWDSEVDISAFRNEVGRARPSFFESRIPLTREDLVRARASELFLQGLVDDELLKPVCYTTEIGPNETLFFRRGGEHALAHIFQTTQFPRDSQQVRLVRNVVE